MNNDLGHKDIIGGDVYDFRDDFREDDHESNMPPPPPTIRESRLSQDEQVHVHGALILIQPLS